MGGGPNNDGQVVTFPGLNERWVCSFSAEFITYLRLQEKCMTLLQLGTCLGDDGARLNAMHIESPG